MSADIESSALIKELEEQRSLLGTRCTILARKIALNDYKIQELEQILETKEYTINELNLKMDALQDEISLNNVSTDT